ncbi:fimbrial protein [Dysgonomonas sp. 37-18]|nr:fimbrial protein [Dysgonomonas sp. 37-18]
MRVIIKLTIYGAILVLLSLGISMPSCSDTEYVSTENKNVMDMLFSVVVPGSSGLKSSLDEDDENDVRSIEVLLFDLDGKYTYQPLYSNVINTNPTDSKVKTFSVKIPEGNYNVVILANSRQSLANALSSISDGEEKSSVMEKLLLSNAGKWNTDPLSGGYVPIPMWGELTSLSVDGNTVINNPVNLVRMVSKIDVALTHVDATSKFVLESIRLYNYNNKGGIAPVSSNWNALQGKVTSPSVPASAQKPANASLNPLVYDEDAITTPGISSIGEIYTFEALAGSSSSLQDNTCLVIGGTYTGDAQPTYYRIDFTQTSSGTTTYLALLRNHHYKVNISEISGSGLATPTDAFNSRPVNIKAEIIQWNDALMSDVVFDGQYMLGVSAGEFSFPRDIQTASDENNTLAVTTDNPSGWTVDKIVDAQGNNINWVSLLSTSGTSVSSGSSGVISNLKVGLTENVSGLVRIGFIHLKAGRLTYIIKVTQDINSAIALSIKNTAGTRKITELIFAAPINTQPDAQQFKIKWVPESSSVTATHYVIGSTGLSLDVSSGLPSVGLQSSISDPSGEKLFTIQPPGISDSELLDNPFLVKISKIDFTVSNGTNNITESIFLRQSTYNIVFSNVSSSYWTNGNTYTFNVRSNAGWRIKAITENITTGSGSLLNLQASDNLKVGAVGSANTGTGTAVNFRVVGNAISVAGQVTVVFESTDSPKKFNDVTLVLNITNEYYPKAHKGWAGSNIYYDLVSGHLTFDDVGVTTHKTYQGVYFQGGSLYAISPIGAYSLATVLYPPLGGTTSNIEWSAIPYPITNVNSNPPSGKTNLDRAYLYEITNASTGVGDICRYLTEKGWAPPGKKWRMPTSNEFNDVSSYSIVGPFVSYTSTLADGTQSFDRGYNKLDTGSPFFPASGYRDTNNSLIQIGTNGMYWSSSANGVNSYAMTFANGNLITTNYELFRTLGFCVRCVVEE